METTVEKNLEQQSGYSTAALSPLAETRRDGGIAVKLRFLIFFLTLFSVVTFAPSFARIATDTEKLFAPKHLVS
jgi:hypothetical protein